MSEATCSSMQEPCNFCLPVYQVEHSWTWTLKIISLTYLFSAKSYHVAFFPNTLLKRLKYVLLIPKVVTLLFLFDKFFSSRWDYSCKLVEFLREILSHKEISHFSNQQGTDFLRKFYRCFSNTLKVSNLIYVKIIFIECRLIIFNSWEYKVNTETCS